MNQEVHLPVLEAFLGMIVWYLITFHMLCALLFVPTILDHQQILQYVTFVCN